MWPSVTLCDPVWPSVTLCDAVWRCVTLLRGCESLTQHLTVPCHLTHAPGQQTGVRGVSYLTAKWVILAPINGTIAGLLRSDLCTFWLWEKVPDVSHLGSIWPLWAQILSHWGGHPRYQTRSDTPDLKCQFWTQSIPDWPQMGQTRNFFQSQIVPY